MALFIPVVCGLATTLTGVLTYETGKKAYEKRKKDLTANSKSGLAKRSGR